MTFYEAGWHFVRRPTNTWLCRLSGLLAIDVVMYGIERLVPIGRRATSLFRNSW